MNSMTEKLTVTKRKEITISDDFSLCSDSSIGNILVPGIWTIDQALTVCKSLGGKQAVVDSRIQAQNLLKLFNSSAQCNAHCNALITGEVITTFLLSSIYFAANNWFWGGWWDRQKEGVFCNVNDDTLLTNSEYSQWARGDPNGDTLENCVSVDNHGLWRDTSCSSKACTFCSIEKTPTYMLRGIIFYILLL